MTALPILVTVSLAGLLGAGRMAAHADVIPSGRADQQLATPMTSIASETAPGPFEGFLALGVVADVVQGSQPSTTMAMVNEAIYRVRPCVELRVADVVGACVGYSVATGRAGGEWVVDLTLISLAWHGIHLSVGAHLANAPGDNDSPASLRLAIPLYAGWMPWKLPKARVRVVLATDAIGAGLEWGVW